MQETKLYALDIEGALLGTLIIEPEMLLHVLPLISYSDFYDQSNALLFKEICDLTRKGERYDILTLQSKFSPAYLLDLTQFALTGFVDRRVEEYARIIRDHSIRRALLAAASKIRDLASSDQDIDTMLTESRKVIGGLGVRTKKKTNNEIFKELINSRFEGKVRGISTGIPFLDEVTLGLKPGQVWVIGAYSNNGKTSFSLEIVRNIFSMYKVWYISLEMPVAEIQDSLLTLMENNGYDLGKAGDLIAYNPNFEIFDDIRSVYDLEARYLLEEKKPDVIFIDYVQLMESEGHSEYERNTNTSRMLQKFAMKNLPTIVELSQVAEDIQKNPTAGQRVLGYKSSGAYGNDANVGLKVEMLDSEGLEIIPFIVRVIKNRKGRKGKAEYQFDKVKYKFLYHYE